LLTTVLHSEGEKLQSRVSFALFRKTIARFVPAEPLDSEILPNIIAKMIKKEELANIPLLNILFCACLK